MSNERGLKELEAPLKLRDRLDFPYILTNQILTLQKAILSKEFSEIEIQLAVRGLAAMIPSGWVTEDQEFEKALKEAIIKDTIDLRPEFCGVKPSPDWCLNHGIKPFEEIETYDYLKLLKACIDLLDRLGLLARRDYTEKVTGKRYQGNEPDIAGQDFEETPE